MYHLDELGALPTPIFIQGMLSIHNAYAKALIDTSATHYFIFYALACKLDIRLEPLEKILTVETPSRGLLVAHCVYKDCKIKTLEIEVFVDLILLDFLGFDVIIGMDLLKKYRVFIDCESKVVTL